MKKLIPAIVMLLVSAVVLSTASYAWFTTSQDVTASGMKVTAEAPTSILIRGITNTEGNWSSFSSGLTFADMGYTNVAASSSKNGVEFFEPAKCSDATGAIEPGSAINTSDNYVDYQIELKNDAAADTTANGGADYVQLRVEEILASESALMNAVRVAIIVGTPDDEASTAAVVAAGTKDQQTGMYDNVFVYTLTSYQGQEQWVKVGTDADGDKNYEYTTNATGPLADTATIAGVAAAYSKSGTSEDATPIVALDGQEYVRITVRVWFEGQDKVCISENAGLSATINVKFGIVGRTIENTQG